MEKEGKKGFSERETNSPIHEKKKAARQLPVKDEHKSRDVSTVLTAEGERSLLVEFPLARRKKKKTVRGNTDIAKEEH